MIGGLLGGLIGGMGGGIGSRIGGGMLGGGLFGGRGPLGQMLGGRRPLRDLLDGEEQQGGRQTSQKIPQPTIGKTGPTETPQLPATQIEQATQSQPEPAPTMGPTERPLEPPRQTQASQAQESQSIAMTDQAGRPVQQPQQNQQAQGPLQSLLDPPAQETPPAVEDAQPLDVAAVDPTQGVQPQEIDTQVQTLPPVRYTPIENAWPSSPAVAPTGQNDPIPAPATLGFNFNRPEGIEDYAAKFTYRRR